MRAALFARPARPDIVKQALRFRRELTRGNDAALREMTRIHAATWRRLRKQFEQMSRQIAAARQELGGLDAVRELHPSWIFRQQRYADLMWQCEQELLYFTRAAAAQVGVQQTAAAQLGQQHAFRMVSDQLPEQIKATWNRLPINALENLVGVMQDGSPLSYKFAGLAQDTAAGIKETIAAGFAQGWNPRKIAREVRRAYDGALINGQLTCRTEAMRAYRTAAQESYKANSDVVDGWIWLASLNGRTCAACWAMHGTLHKLSEQFSDHPYGRCCSAPRVRTYKELFPGLDLSGVKETSAQAPNAEAEFRKLSPADQRRVLGAAKHQLWLDGKIKLSDMATRQRSRVWGDHYRPTTLRELVERGKVTWDDLQEARKASQGPRIRRAERRETLRDFAAESARVFQEITGTENHWSGHVRIHAMDKAAGHKDWNCDISIEPGHAAKAETAYPVVNHEMGHALSVGLTPEAYGANMGWEEGVVEQLQRLVGGSVKDVDGAGHVGRWSYPVYIDQHEALRGYLGIDLERYYLKLIRTPLDQRRVLIERAVRMKSRGPVPEEITRAIVGLSQ